MGIIKNTDLLIDTAPDIISELELAAETLKRTDNINFKIKEYGNNKMIIQAAQDEKGSGEYLTKKQLIGITRFTFDAYFPGVKSIVQPIPFLQSPADIVNHKWILKKMLLTGRSIKMISADTGIERAELKSIINDGKHVSKSMKALFYYYFLHIESVNS